MQMDKIDNNVDAVRLEFNLNSFNFQQKIVIFE